MEGIPFSIAANVRIGALQGLLVSFDGYLGRNWEFAL